MTYVFLCMAGLSFVGFFVGFIERNGHRMAYAAVTCAIWIAAALWWSGRIG